MILNFIFSHLNLFILFLWILFLILVCVRYFHPEWVRNISYNKILLLSIFLSLSYGLFVTWGQYYVWAHGSDITKFLVHSPLSSVVPLPSYLEWLRPLLSYKGGYFTFYVLGRTWLYVFISYFISFVLYLIFRLWMNKRGGFNQDGPKLLLILMISTGWPGVLVLIPLGFVISIILFGLYYFKGQKTVEVEPAFIIASIISVVFGHLILNFFI